MGRVRANSQSNGSRTSGPEIEQLTREREAAQQLKANQLTHAWAKYVYIIVLKSLNDTFETKVLVVPPKPGGIKLGRPANGNATNTTGSACRRSESQQLMTARPDNGNFNSRVLSRSHALLSCDPTSGKVYIHDLRSSNGTFVNGVKIRSEDVELKIGDCLDLGTDIDNKLEHRKISALVEDISAIPMINNIAKGNSNDLLLKQELSSSVSTTTKQPNIEDGLSNAQRTAFDAAMFGDVASLDLDDDILGDQTAVLSNIFMSSYQGTSPNLLKIFKVLQTEINLEARQAQKLQEMSLLLQKVHASFPTMNCEQELTTTNNFEEETQAIKNEIKQKYEKELATKRIELKNLVTEFNTIKAAHGNERREKIKEQEALENELDSLKREWESIKTEQTINEKTHKHHTSIIPWTAIIGSVVVVASGIIYRKWN